MNGAKIRLSAAEMDLVNNAAIILTKNAIVQKAMLLLGELQDKQWQWMQVAMPHIPGSSSPKISKGENYRGLPYLVLDYPRHFEKKDVFMIRSMFWWGHFFSVTLHVSGRFAMQCAPALARGFDSLKKNGFCCCVNEDPWQHHFEWDNYKPVKEMDAMEFEKRLSEKSFIKIAKQIPLKAWDNAASEMADDFALLVQLTGDQFPRR